MNLNKSESFFKKSNQTNQILGENPWEWQGLLYR